MSWAMAATDICNTVKIYETNESNDAASGRASVHDFLRPSEAP